MGETGLNSAEEIFSVLFYFFLQALIRLVMVEFSGHLMPGMELHYRSLQISKETERNAKNQRITSCLKKSAYFMFARHKAWKEAIRTFISSTIFKVLVR